MAVVGRVKGVRDVGGAWLSAVTVYMTQLRVLVFTH